MGFSYPELAFLVTGANKGIGFAIAKYLGLAGWHVLVGARNEKRGLKAVEELKALGVDKAEYLYVNLGDLDELQQTCKLIAEQHGDLNMLVNNVGVPGNQAAVSYETDIKDLIETVQINYIATFAITQALIPTLAKNHGRIVNVTVPTALHEYWNPLAYKGSKAGQNVMTETMGFDFDKNNIPIEIFCVHPGPTTTDLNGNMTGPTFHTADNVGQKTVEVINDGKRHQGEYIEIYPISE